MLTGERMAQAAVALILAAAVAGLAGGVLLALVGDSGRPDEGRTFPGPEACPNPPCAPESLPPLSSLPAALPLLILGLAVFAAGVALLIGAVRALRGSRRLLGTGALVLLGTLLVVIGMEIVPHLVNPCLVAEAPDLCARSAGDVDIADRFHALWHALVGTLPLAAGLWWLLRRWRPDALPRRRAPRRP